MNKKSVLGMERWIERKKGSGSDAVEDNYGYNRSEDV